MHKGINEKNEKEISREIESNRKKIGEGSNFFFEENKKTWKEMEGSTDSGFRSAMNLLCLWTPHVTSPGPSFHNWNLPDRPATFNGGTPCARGGGAILYFTGSPHGSILSTTGLCQKLQPREAPGQRAGSEHQEEDALPRERGVKRSCPEKLLTE